MAAGFDRGRAGTAAVSAVPDLVEPVVGWRAWYFGVGRAALLHSLVNREPWPAREPMVARCYTLAVGGGRLRSHAAPDPGCRCGLYGLGEEANRFEVVKDLLRLPLMFGASVVNVVWGEVALWGRVVEHEQGYRAEYAYPLRVEVPGSFRGYVVEVDGRHVRRLLAPEAARLIAETYGIEAQAPARASPRRRGGRKIRGSWR